MSDQNKFLEEADKSPEQRAQDLEQEVIDFFDTTVKAAFQEIETHYRGKQIHVEPKIGKLAAQISLHANKGDVEYFTYYVLSVSQPTRVVVGTPRKYGPPYSESRWESKTGTENLKRSFGQFTKFQEVKKDDIVKDFGEHIKKYNSQKA